MGRKFIAILFLVALFLVVQYGHTAKLPGTWNDDDGIHEIMGTLTESQIENSRAENPKRKASENKAPWKGDSLWEMESVVWPAFAISPYNWEDWDDFEITLSVPELELYGYEGRKTERPHFPDEVFDPEDEEGWYVAGCYLNCPSSINCVDGPFT